MGEQERETPETVLMEQRTVLKELTLQDKELARIVKKLSELGRTGETESTKDIIQEFTNLAGRSDEARLEEAKKIVTEAHAAHMTIGKAMAVRGGLLDSLTEGLESDGLLRVSPSLDLPNAPPKTFISK